MDFFGEVNLETVSSIVRPSAFLVVVSLMQFAWSIEMTMLGSISQVFSRNSNWKISFGKVLIGGKKKFANLSK